jgi:hypothetical protein
MPKKRKLKPPGDGGEVEAGDDHRFGHWRSKCLGAACSRD